jgi:polysaccharide chain length determinant protein (PEP-CTERM system associated)
MISRTFTPEDYWVMFRRRWVLILTLTIVGGPLAYGISRFLPNRYKSQTLVLVEQQTVPSDFVKPVETSDISQRLGSMQQQILSRTRLEPVIRQFGLFSEEINQVPMDALVERLRKAIEVSPVLPMVETRANDLPGFYVSVTLDNPRIAQRICSTVTSMFIEENLRLRQRHSEDTTQFLTQQLTDAKSKLDQQDAKLAAFKSRYMGSLPDEEKTNLGLLAGSITQLDATTQALSRAQEDKGFAEAMLTQQIAAWKESSAGRNPETLEDQLQAMEAQLADLQAKYRDGHPDVVKVKNSIAAIQKKIAENENHEKVTSSERKRVSSVEPTQVTQLRAQIHMFQQVIAEKLREQEDIKRQIKIYQQRAESSPAIEQNYKELTRDYQTALDFYNELLKKRDQAAMASDLERRQQGEQFRVLDPANLPESPSFPNRRLFALGGFAGGLALGLSIAFLLESRDTSLRTESDVELVLHSAVLAMIPRIEPALSTRAWQPPQQPFAKSEKAADLGVEI